MKSFTTKLFTSLVVTLALLFTLESVQHELKAQDLTIYADEDTYRARAYYFNPGFSWQFQGIFTFEIDDENSSSNFLDASVESSTSDESYWRTIIQYDIDGIDEPVEEAILRLYLTDAQSLDPIGSEPDFNVDLFGSTQNRDSSLDHSAFSAEDEWDNSVGLNTGYVSIKTPFVEAEEAESGTFVEADITSFLNDRIADAQTSGDTFVFFRIQADYFDPTNAFPDFFTRYRFASPYASDEFKPALDITLESTGTDLEITDNEGWRLISSPAEDATIANLLSETWTQGFPGAAEETGQASVLVWNEGDGNINERGFSEPASADDVLDAGQAISVFIYEDEDPFEEGIETGFPKNLNVEGNVHTGTVSPDVSLTESAGGYIDAEDGWNLVGNPYNATIDWDADTGWTREGLDNVIYIYDPETQDYLTWNGTTGTLGDGLIAPWQGFWVKANNTGTPELTMTEDVQNGSTTFYSQSETGEIVFNLESGEHRSQTIMVFHPEANHGYDAFSAYQLQSMSADYLTLFTRFADDPAMDIQSVPTELTEATEFELGINASDISEEMELSWDMEGIPEGFSIELIDNTTGVVLDMAASDHYHFNLSEAGKNTSDENVMMARPIEASKEQVSQLAVRVTPEANVGTDPDETPEQISLEQNYPNPFNPVTIITFEMPVNDHVRLEVFDVLGQRISTLINEQISAGQHQVQFDASDLNSGVYFYRLETDTFVETRKMMLVK